MGILLNTKSKKFLARWMHSLWFWNSWRFPLCASSII